MKQIKRSEVSRFESSGLNEKFTYDNCSFAEYVLRMREIIENARVDLTEQNREMIIDANSPYEWIPPKADDNAFNHETDKFYNGVLLIHGLFDSPYIYEDIAQYFIQKNYLVRAILLPGHGTVPGDLQKIDRQEWIKATEYGVKSFKNKVEKLFVVGFSTGGLLALLQAYNFPIDGLILFAPAIKLRTQFAVVSYINNFMTKTIGGITWYIKADDLDYAKYQSVTLEPAHQVHMLTRALNEISEKKLLDVPIFLVCSANDEVISETMSLNYFSLQPNPLSRMLYYTPKLFENEDPRIIQISSAIPEKKYYKFLTRLFTNCT